MSQKTKPYQWAKIIETEEYQALVTKETKEDEEGFWLNARIDLDGYTVNFNMGYKTKSAREKAFKNFNAEAMNVYWNSINAFKPK